MKERQILMNGAMVRAVLAGTKTQTRRVVKLNAAGRAQFGGRNWHLGDPDVIKACPYGQPGDRLWVRESFSACGNLGDVRAPEFLYMADFDDGKGANHADAIRWKPSIHMPRWASRITLEIVSVRVERLQDISEADAKAEGVDFGNTTDPLTGEIDRDACEAFESLWESINGPGSWDANPWVWVVEFKRIDQ